MHFPFRMVSTEDVLIPVFFNFLHSLCFRIHHWKGPRKSYGTEIKWNTSADGNLLGKKINTVKCTETVLSVRS
jgi:hypothetical protein